MRLENKYGCHKTIRPLYSTVDIDSQLFQSIRNVWEMLRTILIKVNVLLNIKKHLACYQISWCSDAFRNCHPVSDPPFYWLYFCSLCKSSVTFHGFISVDEEKQVHCRVYYEKVHSNCSLTGVYEDIIVRGYMSEMYDKAKEFKNICHTVAKNQS